MRRHALRLVIAALATTALAACADLPTGPKAPTGTRFDGTQPSASDSTQTNRTSTQGTEV